MITRQLPPYQDILTVTFNPSIDKSTTISSIVPDSKLRCMEPFYDAGGGGINVARALARLGGKASALYLSGGPTGEKLGRLLELAGIEHFPISIHESTRENFTVFEETTGQQFRFVFPGPAVRQSEWQALLDLISMTTPKYIVASGTLAPGIPSDMYARIASIAKQKGSKCIVDATGESLRKAVAAGVYLIKPNLNELASLVGKASLELGMVADAALELVKQGSCEIVVVSMASRGAMLVTHDFARLIPAPVIKVKSTVGAGDSMVAGIVYALSKGWSLYEAVRYGVACGSAASMNHGTRLCRAEDAEKLYQFLGGVPMVKLLTETLVPPGIN
ncbi:MAG: 1-phosphofructokinase family hexose kinase [Chitinophagaceae bacterium]|nr:MAG: 1-phosphofructokinase family hexose kinase [Chitinophagaceae bacterium]